MTEEEQRPNEEEQVEKEPEVEDLEVPEGQAKDIAGGAKKNEIDVMS